MHTQGFKNISLQGLAISSTRYLFNNIAQQRITRITVLKPGSWFKIVDYIFIKQDSRLMRIHFDQIRYVEAEKDFSTVFTTDKKLLAGMHLKMFESLLPADRFFRVHRSFIVNLSKISSINGNMVEIGQTEIPIGANYKNELMKRLGIA
jgi:DNA-binding LytR/AlgR family response regulator